MFEYKTTFGASDEYIEQLARDGWKVINSWFNPNGVAQLIWERWNASSKRLSNDQCENSRHDHAFADSPECRREGFEK